MDEKHFNKFIDMIKNVPQARVQDYLDLFDRLLLHVLVLHVLDKDKIQDVVNLWSKSILKAIDYECTQRTNFLESGDMVARAQKYSKEPDGEDLRLMYIQCYNLANEMITSSLKIEDNDF